MSIWVRNKRKRSSKEVELERAGPSANPSIKLARTIDFALSGNSMEYGFCHRFCRRRNIQLKETRITSRIDK